ncbi:hypothetical protein ST37_12250 [Vibrio sp. qd031]|uniref:prepilin peptidase n=1 Tax=Vibrio sp. qd031 TaxID=1603038 RepID=UPI000A10C2B1|nr:prepilin peptidase [Vibrio sp. qd031]ORT49215.1 hypothetical protein ST37_12250 [Vibrio sp. qd031]
MKLLFLFLITYFLFSVAISDWLKRTISNSTLSVLFLAVIGLRYGQEIYLVQALMTLAAGILVWRLGGIGAGDIKLASILALAISPVFAWDLILVAAAITLLLVILLLIVDKLLLNNYLEKGVPMGIPISISGLAGIIATLG